MNLLQVPSHLCSRGDMKTSTSPKEIKRLSAGPQFSKATREDTNINENLSLILFTIESQLNPFLKSGRVDINEANSKLVARLRTDVE